MTDRELMQQALEALMAADPDDMIFDAEGHMVFRKSVAINALRERLAQPERQWVKLTDEEIDKVHNKLKTWLMGTYNTRDIYRALEAKLKEKNGG